MTAPSFELSIGGLRFQASMPAGVVLEEDDHNYRSFASADPNAAARRPPSLPGEVLIPVEIEVGGAPDVDALPIVFEAGTWSAHRTADEILLRLRTPQGVDPYLWTARITSDGQGERVQIHCGSLLVEEHGNGFRVRSPLHYPLDQLLTMYALASRQGLICHAAGLAIGGQGLLFAGRSGAGKTTFMRLTTDPSDIERLSDDRVVIRRVDDSVLVYGTPWAGEGQIAENRARPLAALVFLHQATEHALRRISMREALAQLLPVVSILWFDQQRMEQAAAFCGELVEALPCYELHFRPETEVLDLVRGLLDRG